MVRSRLTSRRPAASITNAGPRCDALLAYHQVSAIPRGVITTPIASGSAANREASTADSDPNSKAAATATRRATPTATTSEGPMAGLLDVLEDDIDHGLDRPGHADVCRPEKNIVAPIPTAANADTYGEPYDLAVRPGRGVGPSDHIAAAGDGNTRHGLWPSMVATSERG